MAFQIGLLAFGPAGWAACAVVTIVMIAGAAGVFDQAEVHEDDYNNEGIYIPEEEYKKEERFIPAEPVENPEIDIDIEEQWQKEKDRVSSLLPYSYVLVYMSHPEDGPDPDPDFEDIRPPSSSFVLGASAYDSGIGLIIAAIMAFALTFWLTREFVEAKRNEVG